MLKREYGAIDFGGGFDPFTIKHAMAVKILVESQRAPWIIVSPAYDHVGKSNMAPFSHRLSMTRLGVLQLPKELRSRVIVSDVEKRIDGKGRTLMRVRQLEKIVGGEILIALGADYLDPEKGLSSWNDYRELIENYDFLLIPRGGHETRPEILPDRVHVWERGLENGGASLARQYAREGKWDELKNLVPPWVFWYIVQRSKTKEKLY